VKRDLLFFAADEPHPRIPCRLSLLSLIAALIFWYALSTIWTTRAQNAAGIDYYQFWIVAQAEKHHQIGNIYTRQSNRDLSAWAQTLVPADMAHPANLFRAVRFWKDSPQINTVATPFLYATIGALARDGGPWMDRYDRDLYLYQIVSMLCCVGAVIALCLSLDYSLGITLLIVAAVYFWCGPLISDTNVANVAQLQLAGVTLFILSRKRSTPASTFLGGLILGLLTAFKPNLLFIPLLLGITWLSDGRWKTLGITFISGCMGLVFAFICGCRFLHSWHAWIDWFRVVPTLTTRSLYDANYTLSAIVLELSNVNISTYLICASVGLVILAQWKSRNQADECTLFQRDYLISAVGCVVALIALPVAWKHYYLLTLPLLIYIFSPLLKESSERRGYIERATAAIILLLLFNDPIESILTLHNPYLIAGLFVCGAWELFFLGLSRLERLGFPVGGIVDPAAAQQGRLQPAGADGANPFGPNAFAATKADSMNTDVRDSSPTIRN
jgi:hypothetical protein